MRNLLLKAGMVFLLTTTMQIDMFAQLVALNGVEICAGLGSENMAHVCVGENLPIPLPPNATIAYTWTVQHSNATWRWYTMSSERLIPIPWPGEYSVQVKMEYVRRGNNRPRPFAAFWTTPLIIHGQNCEASISE